jgi:hypothetical protein
MFTPRFWIEKRALLYLFGGKGERAKRRKDKKLSGQNPFSPFRPQKPLAPAPEKLILSFYSAASGTTSRPL